jgi:hypothetical protein
MPFGSVEYMFYHDLSLLEKSLSFFSHVFVIPAALYGVAVLGAYRNAWLVQLGQTILILFLTYLLTRPEENINWIFGSSVLNVSTRDLSPFLYYSLMVVVPAVFVYLPTNRLLIVLSEMRKRRKKSDENSHAITATNRHDRRALGLLLLTIILASTTSVGIAHFADNKYIIAQSIFDPTYDGPTRFELHRAAITTSVDRIFFGEGNNTREIPLVVWPHTVLPKQWSGSDQKWHAHTKSILLEMPLSDLPAAPQEVVINGIRSVSGSVIWAYVASDNFYVQSHPDLHGASDRYEVRCNIGGRGLSEYVDTKTGRLIPSTAYNELIGDGVGAVYVLGVVEVQGGEIVAKSRYYVVKRTGIRYPEDVWFLRTEGVLRPILSKPRDPINSRVAFQSLPNSGTSQPEVYSSDFWGYELRNLSKNPNRFDGFIPPNGQISESRGWVDDTVLKFYSDREGKLVQVEIKDKR